MSSKQSSVVGLEAILTIAQQLDLKPSDQPPTNHPSITNESSSTQSTTNPNFDYSDRILHLLSQQSELNSQLIELSAIHRDLQLRNETFELTDREFITSRLQMIREICKSFQQFCDKKLTILSKLQKPENGTMSGNGTSSGGLRVYSDYLPHFLKMIKEMEQFAHNLDSSIQMIDWSQTSEIDFEKMNEQLNVIPHLSLKFRKYMESVNQLRNETQNLL